MAATSDPTDVTSVAQLAERVAATTDGVGGSGRRLVIAIAGAPGAGKSTAAEALVDILNRQVHGSAAVLPMDGYHYDDMVLNERGHRPRKGAPHTFDVGGFAHMLRRLQANDEDEVAVPVFDRSIEIARAGARIIPRSVTQLVVEGNYLLLDKAPWSDLADLFDVSVFIDVPEHELRRRLAHRWADLSEADTHAKLEENDLPNARLVMTSSRPADFRLRQVT